jgi:hypothetical protein
VAHALQLPRKKKKLKKAQQLPPPLCEADAALLLPTLGAASAVCILPRTRPVQLGFPSYVMCICALAVIKTASVCVCEFKKMSSLEDQKKRHRTSVWRWIWLRVLSRRSRYVSQSRRPRVVCLCFALSLVCCQICIVTFRPPVREPSVAPSDSVNPDIASTLDRASVKFALTRHVSS